MMTSSDSKDAMTSLFSMSSREELNMTSLMTSILLEYSGSINLNSFRPFICGNKLYLLSKSIIYEMTSSWVMSHELCDMSRDLYLYGDLK